MFTSNTSIDNLACEELWGGTEELASFVGRLRLLANDVHEAGARIGLQLWQGRRFPQGRGVQVAGQEQTPESGDRVAPSAQEDMRELTIPEIESIIYRFAKASHNVRDAGFDCVEIHGAHGYLPCLFTSIEHNWRTDKYGQGIEGRMKFGIDLVMAIRAWVGPDFPIIYRLGAFEDNGSVHPDSIEYARQLEKVGVDCLDVSTAGLGKIPVSPPKRYRMGTFAHLAEGIKKNVNIPVIAVGRINTPEVAEDILAGGQADMVAIGRQLLTDPFWPKKVLEGRQDKIVACDSCNINCLAPIYRRNLPEGSPLCKDNDRLGREWETPSVA